ncbi:hypothetical protein DIPPA_02139 [Diplonema papillatum]|nr:hypothetical protein DIPPA_02139 [Diplonema papillatum]
MSSAGSMLRGCALPRRRARAVRPNKLRLAGHGLLLVDEAERRRDVVRAWRKAWTQLHRAAAAAARARGFPPRPAAEPVPGAGRLRGGSADRRRLAQAGPHAPRKVALPGLTHPAHAACLLDWAAAHVVQADGTPPVRRHGRGTVFKLGFQPLFLLPSSPASPRRDFSLSALTTGGGCIAPLPAQPGQQTDDALYLASGAALEKRKAPVFAHATVGRSVASCSSSSLAHKIQGHPDAVDVHSARGSRENQMPLEASFGSDGAGAHTRRGSREVQLPPGVSEAAVSCPPPPLSSVGKPRGSSARGGPVPREPSGAGGWFRAAPAQASVPRVPPSRASSARGDRGCLTPKLPEAPGCLLAARSSLTGKAPRLHDNASDPRTPVFPEAADRSVAARSSLTGKAPHLHDNVANPRTPVLPEAVDCSAAAGSSSIAESPPPPPPRFEPLQPRRPSSSRTRASRENVAVTLVPNITRATNTGPHPPPRPVSKPDERPGAIPRQPRAYCPGRSALQTEKSHRQRDAAARSLQRWWRPAWARLSAARERNARRRERARAEAAVVVQRSWRTCAERGRLCEEREQARRRLAAGLLAVRRGGAGAVVVTFARAAAACARTRALRAAAADARMLAALRVQRTRGRLLVQACARALLCRRGACDCLKRGGNTGRHTATVHTPNGHTAEVRTPTNSDLAAEERACLRSSEREARRDFVRLEGMGRRRLWRCSPGAFSRLLCFRARVVAFAKVWWLSRWMIGFLRRRRAKRQDIRLQIA